MDGQAPLECRVRFLSFLGIGANVQQAAFIMHTAQVSHSGRQWQIQQWQKQKQRPLFSAFKRFFSSWCTKLKLIGSRDSVRTSAVHWSCHYPCLTISLLPLGSSFPKIKKSFLAEHLNTSKKSQSQLKLGNPKSLTETAIIEGKHLLQKDLYKERCESQFLQWTSMQTKRFAVELFFK